MTNPFLENVFPLETADQGSKLGEEVQESAAVLLCGCQIIERGKALMRAAIKKIVMGDWKLEFRSVSFHQSNLGHLCA